MNICLFDNNRHKLFPFTHTRAIADIRCGILTATERWEMCLQQKPNILTASHLMPLYPFSTPLPNVYVNAGIIADEDNVAFILLGLFEKPNTKLMKGNTLLGFATDRAITDLSAIEGLCADMEAINYDGNVLLIEHNHDIFSHNDKAIAIDFKLVTAGRKSAPIPEGVTVKNADNIFIEASAIIQPGVVLNATDSYIYIGAES
ncbi:MAG: glucose-1-phosphate thymidylyltransferase, partial [Chitinophagia bacterium]|nr:glucose-1-phosphate thymidylyltransferase [Chitinophagia bacterium]